MIIGICGKSCAGKSTLAYRIKELYNDRAIYLNIDKVGHRALENQDVKEELCKCFGEKIFEKNNISRKKLSEIVFVKREEMDKLSTVTWKYMENEIAVFLKENKNKIIILDWLLLPLTDFFNLCDLKILLDVDYSLRKERAMIRDSITSSEFYLRESASVDFDASKFDIVASNVDDVIRKVYILI